MVLVGARKDSETYVRNKKKACEEVGIVSYGTDLPEDVSQEELLKVGGGGGAGRAEGVTPGWGEAVLAAWRNCRRRRPAANLLVLPPCRW